MTTQINKELSVACGYFYGIPKEFLLYVDGKYIKESNLFDKYNNSSPHNENSIYLTFEKTNALVKLITLQSFIFGMMAVLKNIHTVKYCIVKKNIKFRLANYEYYVLLQKISRFSYYLH